MRIVLLGPNGQLGSDLCRAAEADGGIEMVPLPRSRLNLESLDDVASTLGGMTFDALVNCTGYHRTDEAESDAQQAVTVNAHAVARIAKVCADRGVPFIHVSTDYVFDGRASRPYVEDDGIGPLNVYGASKAMGESLALATHPGTVILRVASLFGLAGASGKGGNFVETMIRVGRERGHLRVVDDQVMSPTATHDVAIRILGMLPGNIAGGVYHLVNAGQATWFDFAERILQQAGVEATVEPIPTSEYPLPARRPAYSVLDPTLISRYCTPMPPWQDALDRYLRDKGHTPA